MLKTRLTEEWGLKYPLIQAPMAGAAGGELARAVSEAGGLGMIGVGGATEIEWVQGQAQIAREGGLFGVGILMWSLTSRPELFDALLDLKPFALCLSFGDPTPYIERAHSVGVRVIAQVQSPELAVQALAAGVDAIVAQGTEAGGHTGAVGTLPLVQKVLILASSTDVPVLAGGGIATGHGIAGILAMGCDGVWIGTRFVASRESLAADNGKAALLRAGETDTVLTHVFDIVQGAAWPDEFPGRALANDFTRTWHGQEETLKEELDKVRPMFSEAVQAGDMSQAVIYAGQAAGLIEDVPSARDIVPTLMSDAEGVLRRRAVSLLP